jgi:hypothetical protein
LGNIIHASPLVCHRAARLTLPTSPISSGAIQIQLGEPIDERIVRAVKKAVVLAILPARSGVSASRGRCRYRIDGVEASVRGISVKLSVCSVTLASRGAWRDRHDDVEIRLINPMTGKHTHVGRGSGVSSNGPGWMTMRRDLGIDERPCSHTSDPQTLLKDARLYLLDSRDGGTMRLPFEIPEIRLSETR